MLRRRRRAGGRRRRSPSAPTASVPSMPRCRVRRGGSSTAAPTWWCWPTASPAARSPGSRPATAPVSSTWPRAPAASPCSTGRRRRRARSMPPRLRLGPPQSVSLVAAPDAVVRRRATGRGRRRPGVVAGRAAAARRRSGAVRRRRRRRRATPRGSPLTAPCGHSPTATLSRVTTTGRQVVDSDLSRRCPLHARRQHGAGARRRARAGCASATATGSACRPGCRSASSCSRSRGRPPTAGGWAATTRCGASGEDGIDEQATDRRTRHRRRRSAGDRRRRRGARAPGPVRRSSASTGAPGACSTATTSMPTCPPGPTCRSPPSVDLVWVDQIDGAIVWAIHPWGINAIDKDDDAIAVARRVRRSARGGRRRSTSGSSGHRRDVGDPEPRARRQRHRRPAGRDRRPGHGARRGEGA